jgi:hypothetical protein
LDVQVLADVCRRKARHLQYTGFNHAEAEGTRSLQRVAAEQILRQTDVVDDSSEVIRDAFASIAHRKSVGYRRQQLPMKQTANSVRASSCECACVRRKDGRDAGDRWHRC